VHIFAILDISGAHFVVQGFALTGFLVRFRARQRIRFEKSVCWVLISLQKLVFDIACGHLMFFH
jgi:hypothetical protein